MKKINPNQVHKLMEKSKADQIKIEIKKKRIKKLDLTESF